MRKRIRDSSSITYSAKTTCVDLSPCGKLIVLAGYDEKVQGTMIGRMVTRMKKAIALAVVMLVACAPMSFAADAVCNWAASDNYAAAATGKLLRGVENAGFGWVELFRQPTINENKWEGASKGILYTLTRTLAGAAEAATFFVPAVKIPEQSPACPIEMLSL